MEVVMRTRILDIAKDRTKLQKWIGDRRRALNLTQYDVVAYVGITDPGFLSLVEGGHKSLPLHRVPKLAEVLIVDPLDLVKCALYEEDKKAHGIYRTIWGNAAPPYEALKNAIIPVEAAKTKELPSPKRMDERDLQLVRSLA